LTDAVIEIGPGLGALTRLLTEFAGHVVAIEIDPRLIAELRASILAENLSLVERDALGVNWVDLAKAALSFLPSPHRGREDHRRVRVVANLPYYISTAIIERMLAVRQRSPLTGGPLLHDLTLMLQKEVADRIISEPGGKDYGYLSLLVQYYAEAVKLFEVPPTAFKPAPKVHSAVVRLMIRPRPPVDVADEAKFFSLVRASFAQRRKTILNNLKASSPALGLNQVEAALARAGIDARRRAETLSLAEFASLCVELRI
jgi:16S rRNA (adenine1518-N6/adenine1519-N6)-dimethyltransferase